MTTIVYDHKNKQIACDSRTTDGGVIAREDSIKYNTTGDKLWFLAGDVGDADTFIGHYNPLEEANPNLNVDAVFVIKEGSCAGGVYMAYKNRDNIYKECIVDHDYGTGSGGQWALSALDHGKSAREAVEYAITRDIYSGGKVHVYDINKGEFI